MEPPRILVVDDDPDIQIALRARLNSQGYEVCFADDGLTALSAVAERAPDLVLLDIRLPKEDGFGVLERIKADPALADIPVIMLSAQDPATAESRALESGATAYCRKPFSGQKLLETIAAALDR